MQGNSVREHHLFLYHRQNCHQRQILLPVSWRVKEVRREVMLCFVDGRHCYHPWMTWLLVRYLVEHQPQRHFSKVETLASLHLF